jgi:hypothetical protein
MAQSEARRKTMKPKANNGKKLTAKKLGTVKPMTRDAGSGLPTGQRL